MSSNTAKVTSMLERPQGRSLRPLLCGSSKSMILRLNRKNKGDQEGVNLNILSK